MDIRLNICLLHPEPIVNIDANKWIELAISSKYFEKLHSFYQSNLTDTIYHRRLALSFRIRLFLMMSPWYRLLFEFRRIDDYRTLVAVLRTGDPRHLCRFPAYSCKPNPHPYAHLTNLWIGFGSNNSADVLMRLESFQSRNSVDQMSQFFRAEWPFLRMIHLILGPYHTRKMLMIVTSIHHLIDGIEWQFL